jgi:hypothetical protein
VRNRSSAWSRCGGGGCRGKAGLLGLAAFLAVACSEPEPSSDEEIRDWSRQFTQAIVRFLDADLTEPQGSIRAAPQFLRFYARSEATAQQCIDRLEALAVPHECEAVQDSATRALGEVVAHARRAAEEVEAASSAEEFRLATDGFRERFQKSARAVRDAIEQAPPRVQGWIDEFFAE